MFGDLSSVIAGIAVLAAEANLCGVHEEKGEARMDGHRASQQLAAWRCCSRATCASLHLPCLRRPRRDLRRLAVVSPVKMLRQESRCLR